MKHIVFFVGLCFSICQIRAQADSTLREKDSIDNYVLEQYNKKIEQIEQQRINDSIKRAELESKINDLKTTDNLKKEELQELPHRHFTGALLYLKLIRLDILVPVTIV